MSSPSRTTTLPSLLLDLGMKLSTGRYSATPEGRVFHHDPFDQSPTTIVCRVKDNPELARDLAQLFGALGDVEIMDDVVALTGLNLIEEGQLKQIEGAEEALSNAADELDKAMEALATLNEGLSRYLR
jgi:hypothetical protein